MSNDTKIDLNFAAHCNARTGIHAIAAGQHIHRPISETLDMMRAFASPVLLLSMSLSRATLSEQRFQALSA